MGSDIKSSTLINRLFNQGIEVFLEQKSANITSDIDLVISSEAIPEDHPERIRAQELGIDMISYAEALGRIGHEKKTIAITGTHGKTTVTGMLTSILLQTDLDPTIIIGSTTPHLNDLNFRAGAGEVFLTEACEYRDNFMHLCPHIMVINTLEPDHLDYFKTPERYYQSFQNLAEQMNEEATLILYEDAAQYLDLTRIAAMVEILSNNGDQETLPQLQIPGAHNRHNANSARAAARALGVSAEQINTGLQGFKGTWRRFEMKGELKGAKLYDDYGHHPTEIAATIQAARELFADKNLVIIFQPHQYSRTREFFDEFSSSFTGASEVWITDIYQARDSEEDRESTSAQALADAIPAEISSQFIPLDQLAHKITERAQRDDVFIVMGAGNITQVFDQLARDE